MEHNSWGYIFCNWELDWGRLLLGVSGPSSQLKFYGSFGLQVHLGFHLLMMMAANQTTNNNSIKSILKKEKLNGSNFLDWYRNLRIVLRTEQKLHHLEEALPEAPSATTTAAEEGQSVSTYVLKMKAYLDQMERLGYPMPLVLGVNMILTSLSKDYDQFMQNYNMHGMGKTIDELHAMLKLAEKGIPKKTLAVLAIRQGQIQKPKSQARGKGKQRGKGKSKLAYDPKHKIPPPAKKEHPAKDTECHHCYKTGHKATASGTSGIFTIELFSFPKSNTWIYDIGYGTHICNTIQGLRGYRKLDKGALDLYVGNGHSAVVEAIGSFELILPSGMILIDMHNHISNECSIYTCSNKKTKHDLDSTFLWHCLLGHINKKRIEKLQHDWLLESIDDESVDVCVSCISGKMARKPFTHASERADDLLGIIHSDVCGPFRTTSREGVNYYVTFTEDFSRYGEYLSQEFLDHLRSRGIISQLTPPYTPQHNGVSERRNQTLLDVVRSMMSLTTLPMSFWGYALESVARILNMVPTKKALVKRDTPNKLESRSIKCIFVGYPKETIGYCFYYPLENKVFVARYAEFFETNFIKQEASGSTIDFDEIQSEEAQPSENTSLYQHAVELDTVEPQTDVIPVRRSARIPQALEQYGFYIDAEEHELGDHGEPPNYRAALSDPKFEKWLKAMNAEMQSMKDNQVWNLVDPPPNCKTVRSKWLFKKKIDMDGNIHTYKARLVAKDIKTIRILIAIAAYYDYEIWKMDVKTAFLNGRLNEDVYMVQLEGFVNPKHPGQVCKLQRSIYGLKQASRSWNKRFDEEIKKYGFTQNPDEPCVYKRASGSIIVFIILYVDDILLMGNNIPMLQDVKSWLEKCFAMKDLGEAAYILGIKIYRDRSR
ncbi:putative RNA-directed DNA polymerase [Tanacetum coccineum]